ncbi:hypothetical protein ARMSODRAFT_1026333 [Armillaria solidipes]|uniref:Uncharacterized protein n=1 Tax=Armillaria solidipes TaxID=1076256 RepID=A0A2H3BA93_9AGAR|nr:hypothetical protein ARMSODRAFT_1026333 [Armillaria solidipes]
MLSEQALVHDLLERHRRTLSSPIRKLPVDIMQEIFLLESSNVADITDFSWTATHTCMEWRAIAMQTPMLWSNTHVATDTRNNTRPFSLIEMLELQSLLSTSEGASNEECVGRALELSRDVPHVLSFVHPVNSDGRRLSEEGIEMLDILFDHAPRGKVAYLDAQHGRALFNNRLQRMRGRVPMLESISIEASFSPSGSRISTMFLLWPHGYLQSPSVIICILVAADPEAHPSWTARRAILPSRSSFCERHQTSIIFPKAGIGIRGDTTDFGGGIILPAVYTPSHP